MIGRWISVSFFGILLLAGCGTVAAVRPLDEGECALAFSLGGPVAEVPGLGKIPLPYSVLRYRWGVARNLEAHLGLHPTMLAFRTIVAEAGMSGLLWEQRGVLPALCVGANPTMWVNPFNRAVALKPQAEVAASWLLGRRVLGYAGAQAFFQLSKPHVPWAAVIGSRLNLGKVGMVLEVKWYAPTQDSTRVVGYPLSPGGKGAIGLEAGFTLYPGGGGE